MFHKIKFDRSFVEIFIEKKYQKGFFIAFFTKNAFIKAF